MLIDIALDAVGSDKAPEPEIRGAILACRALPVRVHLIGPEAELHDLIIDLRSQTQGMGTYRKRFDHLAESRAPAKV